jgi:hypothetical protein
MNVDSNLVDYVSTNINSDEKDQIKTIGFDTIKDLYGSGCDVNFNLLIDNNILTNNNNGTFTVNNIDKWNNIFTNFKSNPFVKNNAVKLYKYVCKYLKYRKPTFTQQEFCNTVSDMYYTINQVPINTEQQLVPYANREIVKDNALVNPEIIQSAPNNDSERKENGPMPDITQYVIESVLRKVNDKISNLALAIKNNDTQIHIVVPSIISNILKNNVLSNILKQSNKIDDTILKNLQKKYQENSKIFNNQFIEIVFNHVKNQQKNTLLLNEAENVETLQINENLSFTESGSTKTNDSSSRETLNEPQNQNVQSFDGKFLLSLFILDNLLKIIAPDLYKDAKINIDTTFLSQELNKHPDIEKQVFELQSLMLTKYKLEEEKQLLEISIYKINIPLFLYENTNKLYISDINVNVLEIDKEPEGVAIITKNIVSPNTNSNEIALINQTFSTISIDSLIQDKIKHINEGAKKFQELYDTEGAGKFDNGNMIEIQGATNELSIQYNLFLTGITKLSINFDEIKYTTNNSDLKGYLINKSNSKEIINKAIHINLPDTLDRTNLFENMNKAFYESKSSPPNNMTKEEALRIMGFTQNDNEEFKKLELELNPNPSIEDVKKRYRKLALIYHPNKPGGDTEKFQILAQASEILGYKNNSGGGYRKTYKRFSKSKRKTVNKKRLKKRRTNKRKNHRKTRK